MPNQNSTLIDRMRTALVDASPIITSEPTAFQDTKQDGGEPAPQTRNERLTYGLPVTAKEINRSGTAMQCSGAHNDVSEWFIAYCGRYGPAGYGTRITNDMTVGETCFITTDRARSCD